MSGGSWRRWIDRRRRATDAGTASCWLGIWATSRKHQIWWVLRRHEIALARRRSWCISTDPAFAQKATDVVALYLRPVENDLVFVVDEKPHIQALERAPRLVEAAQRQGGDGFNHEYKRHGTTTLFAAFEVTAGLVKAGHYRRRRRVEFLHFMNRVIAAHPGREIHVILDNLNTHKPKHDRWLARHQNVRFHFTPDARLLAEPGRSLVLYPLGESLGRR